jgi:hypothetical protein
VTEGLTAAAPDSKREASERFHNRVAEKIQAVESSAVLENLAAWLRGTPLNWRVALPAIAVLAISLLAMVVSPHHPVLSLPSLPSVQVVSESSSGDDLAPTLANYQLVANQSLEKLSELLTRQGNKRLPPAPVYTAAGPAPANASF